MHFPSHTKLMSSALVLPLVFACSSMTDAGLRRPVSLSLTAVAGSANTTLAAGAALQITSLKLAVDQASLGSGDQFGCQDCQGNDGRSEPGSVATVVSVPLDGKTAVNLATEQVPPGSYPKVEISLDAAVATPGWPSGQTVEIQGTNNGTPFTVGVAVNGSFQQGLNPSLVVGTPAPTAIPVIITLPVASWFLSGGTALDPTIPAQRAQIEANIRSAFSGPETPE